jgi:hypothetical protein
MLASCSHYATRSYRPNLSWPRPDLSPTLCCSHCRRASLFCLVPYFTPLLRSSVLMLIASSQPRSDLSPTLSWINCTRNFLICFVSRDVTHAPAHAESNARCLDSARAFNCAIDAVGDALCFASWLVQSLIGIDTSFQLRS